MLFKYELNQIVKVQIFNLITKGKIIKRVLYETKLGRNFKYRVQFGENYNDCIDCLEQDLDFVQDLKLGKVE